MHLRSKGLHTLMNEIAESNVASSNHVEKAGEKIVGKMYLYATPEWLRMDGGDRRVPKRAVASPCREALWGSFGLQPTLRRPVLPKSTYRILWLSTMETKRKA